MSRRTAIIGIAGSSLLVSCAWIITFSHASCSSSEAVPVVVPCPPESPCDVKEMRDMNRELRAALNRLPPKKD